MTQYIETKFFYWSKFQENYRGTSVNSRKTTEGKALGAYSSSGNDSKWKL